jgi:ribosome-associated protein
MMRSTWPCGRSWRVGIKPLATGDALDLARAIVDALEEKKGEDILLLDIAHRCQFTDFFVICSATSERMLRSLSDDVQLKMKDSRHTMPSRREGQAESGWVLLDYGDVVVHLMSPQTRAYYKLEELWGDGKILLRLQ